MWVLLVGFTSVSNPHRETSDGGNEMFNVDDIGFPTLIGRLATIVFGKRDVRFSVFPTLIGRLATLTSSALATSHWVFPTLIGRLATVCLSAA